MIRFFVFVYVFFALGFVYGSGAGVTIPGYPVPHLVGSVKKITEFEGTSLENLQVKRVATLNEQGNIVSEELYSDQGGVSVINRYFYNNQGKIQEIVGKTAHDLRKWKYEFRYDEQGKVVEELSWDAYGRLEWRNVFKYSSQDLLAEKIVYAANNAETMRELYRHDDDGRLTAWLVLFPDGKLLKKVEFVYNDIGLVSEERYHNEELCYKQKKYFYNKNSLWERVQTENSGGESEESTLYFYNGDGQLVEEITRDAKGALKARFVITYDHMGNEFSRLDSTGKYFLREIRY